MRKPKPEQQGAQIIPFSTVQRRAPKLQPIPAKEPEFEDEIDIEGYLIKNYDATVVIRARNSNADLDVRAGDLLVVDRKETPRNGDLIITDETGLTIRRYAMRPVAVGERPEPVYAVVMHRIQSYRKGD